MACQKKVYKLSIFKKSQARGAKKWLTRVIKIFQKIWRQPIDCRKNNHIHKYKYIVLFYNVDKYLNNISFRALVRYKNIFVCIPIIFRTHFFRIDRQKICDNNIFL